MENYTGTLVLAGIAAGLINFFANYINLPFSKSSALTDDTSPQLKDIWWVALPGYIIVGIGGAFLTPLIDALVGGLKGLGTTIAGATENFSQGLIAFGYGLVFGYSTTRLLISLLDSITKKISSLELKLRGISLKSMQESRNLTVTNNATDIINECESQFEAFKSDCSGFVKAVAAAFSVTLTGVANDIVTEIQKDGWLQLGHDGAMAKTKADNGWLVIGGLSGNGNDPPQQHGHVVIVVSGPINQNKYPSAYWGKLGGTGEKDKTINWAWNAKSRDKVIYSARQL